MHNKVAAFIISGGQDNVQADAGQMLCFVAELDCHLPPFPYIAHSLGRSAEDMEHNVEYVANSKALREGAADLVSRSINVAKVLLASEATQPKTVRGGRNAHLLDVRVQIYDGLNRVCDEAECGQSRFGHKRRLLDLSDLSYLVAPRKGRLSRRPESTRLTKHQPMPHLITGASSQGIVILKHKKQNSTTELAQH